MYSPPTLKWGNTLLTSNIRYIVTSTTQPYAIIAQYHSVTALWQAYRRERAHFTQHRIPREKGTAQQVALKGGEFPQASKIAADWKVGADWVPGTPKKGGLKVKHHPPIYRV